MTIGEALRKRLAIYQATCCEEWVQFTNSITEQTTTREIWLHLPRLHSVIPRKKQRQWLARQIALAIKMHKAATK